MVRKPKPAASFILLPGEPDLTPALHVICLLLHAPPSRINGVWCCVSRPGAHRPNAHHPAPHVELPRGRCLPALFLATEQWQQRQWKHGCCRCRQHKYRHRGARIGTDSHGSHRRQRPRCQQHQSGLFPWAYGSRRPIISGNRCRGLGKLLHAPSASLFADGRHPGQSDGLAVIFSRSPREQFFINVFHTCQFTSPTLCSIAVAEEQCTVKPTSVWFPGSYNAPAADASGSRGAAG